MSAPAESAGTEPSQGGASRLLALVGSYEHSPHPGGGGIQVFDVQAGGHALVRVGGVDEPKQAGYLAYAAASGTLYAVDERKTDGRGPVQPPASVHAFTLDPQSGHLTWLNARPALGPFPTFLAVDEARHLVVCASHGSFEHVERVVPTPGGGWTTEYVYDDSTVTLYVVEDDGRIGDVRDLQVLTGHGQDPNRSPQAGGHGQASAHAHCAVIDPSGRHVLVCDKGTDRIHVFRLGDQLDLASTFQLPPETGPRHVAFDAASGRAFVTLEFASELASFDFDAEAGTLSLLDRQPTVDSSYQGPNEPAEVRVHPGGGFVYVNNRGEDSLAWFRIDAGGALSRQGHVPLSASIHPGLAARSFAFDPSGTFLLVADRPANLLRSYAVDPQDGSPKVLTDAPVQNPAFVLFAQASGTGVGTP